MRHLSNMDSGSGVRPRCGREPLLPAAVGGSTPRPQHAAGKCGALGVPRRARCRPPASAQSNGLPTPSLRMRARTRAPLPRLRSLPCLVRPALSDRPARERLAELGARLRQQPGARRVICGATDALQNAKSKSQTQQHHSYVVHGAGPAGAPCRAIDNRSPGMFGGPTWRRTALGQNCSRSPRAGSLTDSVINSMLSTLF